MVNNSECVLKVVKEVINSIVLYSPKEAYQKWFQEALIFTLIRYIEDAKISERRSYVFSPQKWQLCKVMLMFLYIYIFQNIMVLIIYIYNYILSVQLYIILYVS